MFLLAELSAGVSRYALQGVMLVDVADVNEYASRWAPLAQHGGDSFGHSIAVNRLATREPACRPCKTAELARPGGMIRFFRPGSSGPFDLVRGSRGADLPFEPEHEGSHHSIGRRSEYLRLDRRRPAAGCTPKPPVPPTTVVAAVPVIIPVTGSRQS